MNVERMYRMHKMIQNESTGTRAEFAEKFNIKPKQLHNQIEELRLWGAVIEYSRKKDTYYYKEPFNFFDEIDYVHFSRQGSNQFIKELLKYYLENKDNNADKE